MWARPEDNRPSPSSSLVSGDRLLLALWFGYLVASPFYVFKSGLPQPADLAMAILILLILSGSIIRAPAHWGLYAAGAGAFAWCAIVNVNYFAIYQQARFAWSILYYGYNFAIIICAVALASKFRDRFFEITSVALLVTVCLEVGVILLDLGGGGRKAGYRYLQQSQPARLLGALDCRLLGGAEG